MTRPDFASHHWMLLCHAVCHAFVFAGLYRCSHKICVGEGHRQGGTKKKERAWWCVETASHMHLQWRVCSSSPVSQADRSHRPVSSNIFLKVSITAIKLAWYVLLILWLSSLWTSWHLAHGWAVLAEFEMKLCVGLKLHEETWKALLLFDSIWVCWYCNFICAG